MHLAGADFVGQDHAHRPQPQHHVAELGDGGIGQHALDIVGGQTHGRGEDGREAPYNGHHGNRLRRVDEEGHGARHQVNAGGDHRGGMDEGADGGGAFHSVRQPHVERELGALAGRPGEDANGRPHQDRAAQHAGHRQLVEAVDIEGAGVKVKNQDAGQETEVANPGDNEGLLGGVRGRFLVEPEPDEEVGAESHHLPEDEGEEEVIGEDQPQHGEGEEGHPGVVAVVARFIVGHVAQRVYLDHQADHGHGEGHDHGKLVGYQAEVDGHAVLDDHPGDIRHGYLAVLSRHEV